jgi:hypothetical protein
MNKNNQPGNPREENTLPNDTAAKELENQNPPAGRADLSDADISPKPNAPRWRSMVVLLPGGIVLVLVILVVLGILFFSLNAHLSKNDSQSDLSNKPKDALLTDNPHSENQNTVMEFEKSQSNTEQKSENTTNSYDRSVYPSPDNTLLQKSITDPNGSKEELAERSKVYQAAEELNAVPEYENVRPNTEQKNENAPDSHDHSIYLMPDSILLQKGITDPNCSEKDIAERTKVYQAAEKMIQSGRLTKMLKERRIVQEKPVKESLLISSKDLDIVRKEIIKNAGLSWPKASSVAREAATFIVVEQATQIHSSYYQYWKHLWDLEYSEIFKNLSSGAVQGFANLSNENVFLESPGMARLAREMIKQAYPKENPAIQEYLANILQNTLWARADNSKSEFTLYVRKIRFGTPDFGIRERFLPYPTFPQRQEAIEQAIYEVLKKHPQYQYAIISPFVKQDVRRRAQELAEFIRNVPPPQ